MMEIKKAVFANRLFYILLIGFIITLFVYNAFIVIKWSNTYGLIPMVIEIGLLTLIFTKSRYVKVGIITWVVVFLIIGRGFELIADLIDDFNNDFKIIKITSFVYNIIGLAFGILIIDYTRRTVFLISSDSDSGQASG
jgi:uncharacterized protein YacL